jgi:hypothetical protein
MDRGAAMTAALGRLLVCFTSSAWDVTRGVEVMFITA